MRAVLGALIALLALVPSWTGNPPEVVRTEDTATVVASPPPEPAPAVEVPPAPSPAPEPPAPVEATTAPPEPEPERASKFEVRISTPEPEAAEPPPPPSYVEWTPETRGRDWDAVAGCESGGRWDLVTGNGYRGGLQWALGTWRDAVKLWTRLNGPNDLPAWPEQATREQQIVVADVWLDHTSWQTQWPVCGANL